MIPIVKSSSLLRRYLSFLFIFLALSSNAQELVLPSVAYTYVAAGNRVTTILTLGNDGSRSASSIVSPLSGQNVENAVTNSRKNDVSSADNPQKLVGNIADERKNHQSSENKQHDS